MAEGEEGREKSEGGREGKRKKVVKGREKINQNTILNITTSLFILSYIHTYIPTSYLLLHLPPQPPNLHTLPSPNTQSTLVPTTHPPVTFPSHLLVMVMPPSACESGQNVMQMRMLLLVRAIICVI